MPGRHSIKCGENMTRVYVVLQYDYDETYIKGIFFDKDKADKFKQIYGFHEVEEYKVMD